LNKIKRKGKKLLYILSQNKKLLMEFGRIEISKNFTGKSEEKYVLSASGRGLANPVIVGMYASEDAASAELSSIITHMHAGASVYEIK